MEDLLGQHRLQLKTTRDYHLVFGENRIEFNSVGSSLSYRRYVGSELAAEAMMVSNEDPVIIGVFPNPPLFTPAAVAKNLYLKFRTPVVVDQGSQAVVYAKMPIEIGVYRQSNDEEMLIEAQKRIVATLTATGTDATEALKLLNVYERSHDLHLGEIDQLLDALDKIPAGEGKG